MICNMSWQFPTLWRFADLTAFVIKIVNVTTIHHWFRFATVYDNLWHFMSRPLPPVPFWILLGNDFVLEYPGRIYIPPPPHPHFWPWGIFQGRGVGVYRPHAAGILYAPPFYTPLTPRRVFSGVGGVGVYKIWPRRRAGSTTDHGETRRPDVGIVLVRCSRCAWLPGLVEAPWRRSIRDCSTMLFSN